MGTYSIGAWIQKHAPNVGQNSQQNIFMLEPNEAQKAKFGNTLIRFAKFVDADIHWNVGEE